ncbi:MAG TPA: hypothetical protein PKM97_06330 [Bacteroidia bacterium]|nr:hypothetical protein [Bacteroidia bacterium]
MKRKILISILILILAGIATGVYLFNKPRQSIMNATAVASLSASALVSEFEEDEAKSNELYLGKVIEVTGIIGSSSLDESGNLNITLLGGDLAGVGCQLEKNNNSGQKKLIVGETVTIKGICTGILMDVVLVDCVITE